MRRPRAGNSIPLIFGYLVVFMLNIIMLTVIWYWGWWVRGMETLICVMLTMFVLYLDYQANLRLGHASVVENSPEGVVMSPAPRGDGWLLWLGNGESHRGTLVALTMLFWSLFFWSMPAIQENLNENFVFIFAAWGLITIIATIVIRTLFVRQTNLPSGEVSASAESKSKGK